MSQLHWLPVAAPCCKPPLTPLLSPSVALSLLHAPLLPSLLHTITAAPVVFPCCLSLQPFPVAFLLLRPSAAFATGPLRCLCSLPGCLGAFSCCLVYCLTLSFYSLTLQLCPPAHLSCSFLLFIRSNYSSSSSHSLIPPLHPSFISLLLIPPLHS